MAANRMKVRIRLLGVLKDSFEALVQPYPDRPRPQLTQEMPAAVHPSFQTPH